MVLDVPCHHNSLFAHLSPGFHAARERLLAKWPRVRPLYSAMGRLDTMHAVPPPVTWMAEQEQRLAEQRQRLAAQEAEVAALTGQVGALGGELAGARERIGSLERGSLRRLRARLATVRRH